MRKLLIGLCLFALTFFLTGCNEQGWAEDVPYTVATGYFTKNVPTAIKKSVIYSKSEFDSMFGAAATAKSVPTKIDFSKSFVIAVMQKSVDTEQTISPYALQLSSGVLQFAYTINKGEKLSYTIAPLLIVVVSRDYADCEVGFFEM